MLNRIFSAVDSLAELGEPLDVRVGLHSGPVVARVIGRQKFSDDLWGGTVNLASRMDGAGRPGRVNDDAAALRAGTPHVIIPHLADPFYHAHRLASLGVVPPGIRISNLTGARLGQAIEAALALPAGPREAMAERLRRGDGLARAIAGIERLATTRRGVSGMQKAKGDSRVSVPLDRRYRKEKT